MTIASQLARFNANQAQRIASKARAQTADNEAIRRQDAAMAAQAQAVADAEQYRLAAEEKHRLAIADAKAAANGLTADDIEDFLAESFRSLIGLDTVKNEVRRQAHFSRIQKLRADEGLAAQQQPSRHMLFLGPPGTGKTTVARIVARLYQKLGLLNDSKVIECDRAGLVAEYVGKTAIKTQAVIESALGGVLFIDEAYALARGGSTDFGKEAIDTLLKAMEDHRDDLIVIAAGYTDEMQAFIETNPGLASRFNRQLLFPNYTASQLVTIFQKQFRSAEYALDEVVTPGIEAIFKREIAAQRGRFGNARFARNLFEKAIESQAGRVFALPNKSRDDLQRVTVEDIESALREKLPAPATSEDNYRAVLSRLHNLTGLTAVKEQVDALADFVRLQRRRAAAGIKTSQGFSQHLVFEGSPGTGKTTVARMVADLYFALGVVPSNRIVEVARADLIAGHVGQTAIKTQAVIEKALGGILFIDEAYTLAGTGNDFGQEAIDTLLKAMEDQRENLIVIVAGYTDRMRDFIDSNPGLASRFNHYLNFADYRATELLQIFERICVAAEYRPTDDAVILLADWLDTAVDAGQTTGNGRFVRNLFERTVEQQAERIMKLETNAPEDLQIITADDIRAALRTIAPQT